MQRYSRFLIRNTAFASVLWAALPPCAFAATGEPTEEQIELGALHGRPYRQ